MKLGLIGKDGRALAAFTAEQASQFANAMQYWEDHAKGGEPFADPEPSDRSQVLQGLRDAAAAIGPSATAQEWVKEDPTGWDRSRWAAFLADVGVPMAKALTHANEIHAELGLAGRVTVLAGGLDEDVASAVHLWACEQAKTRQPAATAA